MRRTMRYSHLLPRRPLGRALFGLVAVALALWTAYWVTQGTRAVASGTFLGRGELGGSLDAHELWELVFFGAHFAIRWALGAVPMALVLAARPLGLLMGRLRGRIRSRSSEALPST